MERPDVSRVLEPLKPFQRRTVDHAFHRLFLANDSTARFLVADEVGLGKTLVARGVIARTIEHLWDEVRRLDIVYICSNSNIARSNLQKLQVGGGAERSFATRLTMLATELASGNGTSLAANKLNFVSFTPGTSFNLRSSGGRVDERVVLFHLLKGCVDRKVGLMNLLQMTVGKDRWRRLAHREPPLDETIRDSFLAAYSQSGLDVKVNELTEDWFWRYRKRWPEDVHWRRTTLVGDLRVLLAKACVDALEPDLVILDEFQRFKTLLEPSGSDTAVELAQSLFGAKTPEGRRVRMLLLSATPYKLYTADAEIEREDHYEDFIATTRFLFEQNEGHVARLQDDISRFGTALKTVASGGTRSGLDANRDRVQERLRKVMARTERVGATVHGDSMVKEVEIAATPTPADVRQYLWADEVFRKVGDRDPMPYWKSASYLPQFMHGYLFNKRLASALEETPEEIDEVLRRHRQTLLGREELESWQAIDPGNAKLRAVVSELLDTGLWRLLWLPPTIPYWRLEGPYAGMEHTTKTLLFSAWNVVPDAVSGILSYEAERRMVDGSRVRSYDSPERQQGRLLRLNSAPRSRHRLLLMLLPCLPLADIHPLEAVRDGTEPRDWMRARIAGLMEALPNPEGGQEDDRWEWIAPLLLDPGLRGFLEEWQADHKLPHPNRTHFGEYVDDLLALDVHELGRRPAGLLDLLTDVALGSPAVLAMRTAGMADIGSDARRRVAVTIAEAFWHLFNRPAVISLLTNLDSTLSRDGSYWRLVLRYCQQGNLQAVLDEQWHLLWEQNAWAEEVDRPAVAESCAKLLAESVRPKPSRVHVRLFDGLVDGTSADVEEIRLRTVFALRYGTTATDDVPGTGEKRVSEDIVRGAFNSPFRPFVLASTSIGQEGLDFHPWCHRIVHWDLPGNPVDLEQREGRVHRYKGHAVRRNIAERWREGLVANWRNGDDLWQKLFEAADAAARSTGENDLVPCWVSQGNFRVERRVPLLPYTKEESTFARLKRQLAAYRVVFGQPRQEELLSLLDQSELDLGELRQWAIDLSPPM
ncbi:MAG: DEAD/DEAH box helicase [Gammaproteobacteria bacterium]|nr:DEAD/DEAH box helicase [Gammaproteobacteria bacterium]MYE52817.1 DEAD/DEAH box helicase [Gammaproteobacteria bacterium]MYF49699.1 DEAD/DEAH box helicase [Gammaproteobacteria bacterium]